MIANRGEIAVRIMRTCKDMGIRSVAVYSETDISALHRSLADGSIALGGNVARESYLDMEKILNAARKADCDAIHPGYGFLSENATFADLVRQEGIKFIGPSPETIRSMGDKTAARALAKSLGVPIVPGVVDTITSLEEAKAISMKLGYPVLIKAAAGGGGKGMRIVKTEAELATSLTSARSEALSAFSDDRVFIEKLVHHPRHIEVQILADGRGNVIHLGERECSIQRRHQKLIEESPSSFVTQTLRDKLTEAALELARAGNYESAGTIEFLVDHDSNFYFLEMNTRLQVEHTVTEMRTGLDLVREQVRIAQGETLSVDQKNIPFHGHAMEFRVNAEDPLDNFFPSTGTIAHLRSPAGPYVREDRGVVEGDTITSYYDSLLAKLVTWGENRDSAIQRMNRALKEYEIYGIKTNLCLGLWLFNHPDMKSGNFSTAFIEENFHPELVVPKHDEILNLLAAAAAFASNGNDAPLCPNSQDDRLSRWIEKKFDDYR